MNGRIEIDRVTARVMRLGFPTEVGGGGQAQQVAIADVVRR